MSSTSGRRRTRGESLSAAVLAGGASRRMGTDKALLELDGQTLLERAIVAVSNVADDVIIVGDRQPYHDFGVPVIRDSYPETGPIGGIATALQDAQHDYVLVVACDMPFLSSWLLSAMADVPRDYDVLLPVTDGSRSSQGQQRTYETLHAIYHRRCLDTFRRRIELGERKLVNGLAGLIVHELSQEWILQYDPDFDSFVNANNQEEWEAAVVRRRSRSAGVEESG